MSWVFLTKSLVFKLKKPVQQPYLDFSTLTRREAACREELAINQQLAPGVYLRLARLAQSPGGGFVLDGSGAPADWLVVMTRLDAHNMLDARLSEGPSLRPEIENLARLLVSFYSAAPPDGLTEAAYPERFASQFRLDRSVILQSHLRLNRKRAIGLLDCLDRQLAALDGALRSRVSSGCIIEGHGDLRPEHVWLGNPVRIIDRLEFNRDLRLIDPFDELSFLGMECALAGAAWIAPLLLDAARCGLANPPPDAIVRFYSATRAVLRARLSLAHLFDPVPRDPDRWEPQAERYLDQAEAALNPVRP